ncbi:MAG: crotonase/enoyl-CoA hydratase family protein [Gammaproteobacteria bacterium]|nr:crotonase/enoyl-CoA hydratase family protein [Gammaproteobacteria bacterium]
MADYKCFDVAIENHIAHIQLTRPEKRNSMIPEFWTELPAIVAEIDQQAQARVIVISSTGPHFTAGLDIQAFFNQAASDADSSDPKAHLAKGAKFYAQVKDLQDSFSILEQCRIPVLVAIQGGCIGGGIDMVTACDMRYATADAFFILQETNIGMTADVGTFPRLPKLIPEGIARELAYTGRRFEVAEAQRIGLVNAVFDDAETMVAAVMQIAAEIASKAPLAIAGCKRIINYARDHSTADTLDYIRIWNASHLQTDETIEAIGANAEQREAQFAQLPKKSPFAS